MCTFGQSEISETRHLEGTPLRSFEHELNERNKRDIDQLYRENAELRQEINEMDQYNRKANVIIYGIPTANGKNRETW